MKKVYLFILIILLAGCLSENASKFISDPNLFANPTRIPVPEIDDFTVVAWVNTDEIVIRTDSEFFPHTLDYKRSEFYLYNLVTQEIRKIKNPLDLEICKDPSPSHFILENSPFPQENTFIVIVRCDISNAEPRFDKENWILIWDYQEDTFITLLHLPPGRAFPTPGFFSADPKNEEAILEINYQGISNELLWVGHDGQLEEIPLGMDIATSPSWSPDGKEFVFLGVPNLPNPRTNLFSSLLYNDEILSTPYNLYRFDKETELIDLLVEEIQNPVTVLWSPSGDHLAFRGQYGDRNAVWIYNFRDRNIYYISNLESERSKRLFFSWSPNGDELIVYDAQKHEELIIFDIRNYFAQ